ncbi:MAG: class I lanthipeptide [Tenacibaculum sp.]|nr:class I lanthipeptide [Tenacibaculum sp.]
MKKIKLTKGLQINKEVVSKLQEDQMADVKGGKKGLSCLWKSCNSSNEDSIEA